jgi:hypothetical protein
MSLDSMVPRVGGTPLANAQGKPAVRDDGFSLAIAQCLVGWVRCIPNLTY